MPCIAIREDEQGAGSFQGIGLQGAPDIRKHRIGIMRGIEIIAIVAGMRKIIVIAKIDIEHPGMIGQHIGSGQHIGCAIQPFAFTKDI